MSKKIELECKTYKKAFKVYGYDVTNRGRRFCSISCQHTPPTKDISTKEEIKELYWNRNISTNGLACHYKVSKGLIYNWFKIHSIKTRKIAEAVSIAQTGVKHTKEHSLAISKGSEGKITPWLHGRNNHMFKKISGNSGWAKGGTREDLGIYVRSSWEANYCRYLNFLKDQNIIYDWSFEPDTFHFKGIKKGCVTYTPDFKIWEYKNSEPHYVEVKGWMCPKSITKLKRMAKYYPDIILKVVSKKEYEEIKSKLSKIISNWE